MRFRESCRNAPSRPPSAARRHSLPPKRPSAGPSPGPDAHSPNRCGTGSAAPLLPASQDPESRRRACDRTLALRLVVTASKACEAASIFRSRTLRQWQAPRLDKAGTTRSCKRAIVRRICSGLRRRGAADHRHASCHLMVGAEAGRPDGRRRGAFRSNQCRNTRTSGHPCRQPRLHRDMRRSIRTARTARRSDRSRTG